MKNVQAQFQMLDSYVKEYNLKTTGKLLDSMSIEVNGQVGFAIVKITERGDCLIGEIELTNDLDLIVEKEVKAQIKIKMGALFQYTNKEEKDKFEKMLKINGATTLSHFIRTYIHMNTGMSGMPKIITPMINFIECFDGDE
jgi:preprotein translocase subunit SecB